MVVIISDSLNAKCLLLSLLNICIFDLLMNTYWISFQRNEKGETPLHRACIEGNLKKVEKLIEQVFHVVITLYFMNDYKLV